MTDVTSPSTTQKLLAEAFGTFVLVFGGCGSAIFAAAHTTNLDGATIGIGIGYLGVALAFGLTVVVSAYAVGHISGGHFNPAVTVGAAIAGRTPWREVPGYLASQVVAGLIAGAALYAITSGKPGFNATGNMAANGYGEHSPAGYSLVAVLATEILLTAIFIVVILGATSPRAPQGFAPLAIGLTLTLIHLISIPISNTSVNPARSVAVAFFNGNGAPQQLWLFIVAPLIGAAIAGAAHRTFTREA